MSVPSKPKKLTTSVGDKQITLHWEAPTSNGGFPILDYLIQFRNPNDPWSTFNDGTYTRLTSTVTGLTNKQYYEFRVSAINRSGTSPSSNIATSSPQPHEISPPARLSSLITIPGSTRIYAQWRDGDNHEDPIDSYRVTKKQGSGSESTVNATIPNYEDRCIIDDLSTSTSHTISVYPKNIEGEALTTSSTVTTTAKSLVPLASTNLNLVIHRNSFKLTWTAPTNTRGKPITDYMLEFRINDGQWLILGRNPNIHPQVQVSNLARKRKTDLRVYAVTDNGVGEPSSIVTIPAVS